MNEAQDINHDKLMELFGNVFSHISGAVGLLMSYLGDQTGVYRAMDKLGSAGVSAIAAEAKVAHGYITFEAETEEFYLSPEQAVVFCREGEPQCLQGLIQGVIGQMATQDVALEVFKTGRGRPWSEHHMCCFCGTDRFFRPALRGYYTTSYR